MGLSVLAIDPGTTQSAWVHLREGAVARFGLDPNPVVRRHCEYAQTWGIDGVAIEMIASYGMPVGEEVFETVIWIGRFYESLLRCNIAEKKITMIKRQEVKLALCKSAKANDASIRQALIDRYGPGKDIAVGTKAKPGRLYGLKRDLWSALAVAETWTDSHRIVRG